MKKIFLPLFIFLAVLLGFYFYQGFIKKPASYPSSKPTQNTKKEKTTSKPQSPGVFPEKIPAQLSHLTPAQTSNQTPEIPSQHDLKVPFVPQAPFGVWDDLHNNACEETAILLVHYYKKGSSLSKEQADSEIKKMVDYQIKKYGEHKDLNAQEIADLAKEFYGYKSVRVEYDFSWEEVKKKIVEGKPVIVPTAGYLLNNPYYRRPGPVYHALVIRGYNAKELITNDPGTKRGEGYRYSYQTLDRAIHNWTGSPETIEQGKRVMIIIED